MGSLHIRAISLSLSSSVIEYLRLGLGSSGAIRCLRCGSLARHQFCDGSCDVLRTLPTLVQQGVKSLGNFTSITLPFISWDLRVSCLLVSKASLSIWTDEHLGKIFAAREFGCAVCLVIRNAQAAAYMMFPSGCSKIK